MGLTEDLYREVMLEHYRSRANYGQPEGDVARARGDNPSCGDEMEIFIRAQGGEIVEAKYEGSGCCICCASANMLCEAVKGRSLAEGEKIGAQTRKMIVEGDEESMEDVSADLDVLRGVRRYPSRVVCAMLPWSAFAKAMKDININE